MFAGIDTIAALQLILELFKPINVTKRSCSGLKKSFSRPSKLEIHQSFIYYVNVCIFFFMLYYYNTIINYNLLFLQSVSQLKEIDDEKSKKALRTGERLQPYMIFVNTDGEVTYFYVIINKHFYKVESALKAIDICFKSFFVFNLNYPSQCQQIWEFIQKCLYEINTKFDKNFQNVNSLINDLNIC